MFLVCLKAKGVSTLTPYLPRSSFPPSFLVWEQNPKKLSHEADLDKVPPTHSNLNNMNKALHKAKGKAKANEHVPPMSFNLILDSSRESKPSEKAKDADGVLHRKPNKKRKRKPLECVDFVKEYLTWWQKKKAFEREVEDKTKNLVKEGANSPAMTNSTILINMPKIMKTM